ncbi:NADPH:quinone reductase-like Zn-dependent oxidoreductase [Lentzea atacamensis]|uniref:NADPH:quinone reductase-like Zn-dependent oxidoreductase n=1 Tax=Lentzea atacamensis TaxID=531938 RepID=A0ABX9E765_9PSEU|nr:NAD(P)-dependent alcohol dehydrogenase [Lentzea atacamensis]RAS65046.1 NADPH:quinone reductase-like Zn-dependent oxidoreductase [Lentzea atacamensis]
MKAVVQRRYGSAVLGDLDVPVPGQDEVLLEVRAAGVDMGTWHLLSGRPYLLRVIGFGFRGPKSPVPGMDVSGVVREIGPGVTGFAVGDEVFGVCSGSFAEYAVAPVSKLARKPEVLSFTEAAAVPISGGTALQALRGVHPGQRVLVLGAGGGVGSYGVQIARALGAHVTGVCSTPKVELVRELGAQEVVDYTVADFTGTYDLILDCGGHRSLSRLRKALTPAGTLVLVGSETTEPLLGGFDRALRAMALNPFVSQKLVTLMSRERGADYDELGVMIEAGAVKPAVDRTFPLSAAVDAISYVYTRRSAGKVVVTI